MNFAFSVADNQLGPEGANILAGALHVNSSMNKIKVNECELPIDVLKTGVEVDLSRQKLRVVDAIIIAACINVSSSLKSIDLSGNRIALNGEMAGVDALAEALKVNASLNSLK